MDENVPQDVIRLLLGRGHAVDDSKKALGEGVPDAGVAKWAHDVHGSVVTFNVDDYRGLVGRRANTRGAKPVRFPHAGAVFLHCDEPRAKELVEMFIETIEHELTLAGSRWTLHVEIYPERILIVR